MGFWSRFRQTIGRGRIGGRQDTQSEKREDQFLLLVVGNPIDGTDQMSIGEMEDELIRLVAAADAGEVDGHGTDFTTGDVEIFLYGPSSDDLLQAIKPQLQKWISQGVPIKAFQRYGSVEKQVIPVSFG